MKIVKNLWQKVISLKEVFKAFPCEFAMFFIALFFTSTGTLIWEHTDGYVFSFVPLGILPVILPVLYFANCLTEGKKSRFVYYLVGLAGVILMAFYFGEPPSWIFGVKGQHSVLFYVAFIPIIFLAKRNFYNQKFAKEEFNYLIALSFAIITSSIVLAILSSIFGVIGLLFGIEYLNEYEMNGFSLAARFSFYICLPLLLFSFVYFANKKEFSYQNKWIETLVNYLFSLPAFIYVVILNIYAITILIRGELPEGMVAALVIACVISIYLMKSLRTLFSGKNKVFDFMYRYVSWMLILPAFLFWKGLAYRIGEYGITENRIYLIVFGVIMTLWMVTDLIRKGHNYYALFSVIVVSALLMLYVPFCSPYHTAMKHQTQVVKESLPKWDLKSDTLNVDSVQNYVDSLDKGKQKRFAGALNYIEWEDSLLLEKHGISHDNIEELRGLRFSYGDYNEDTEVANAADLWFNSVGGEVENLSQFQTFVIATDCSLDEDNLMVFKDVKGVILKKDVKFIVDQLIENGSITQEQLATKGYERFGNKNLIYEDDEVLILFGNIGIQLDKDGEILYEETNSYSAYLFMK